MRSKTHPVSALAVRHPAIALAVAVLTLPATAQPSAPAQQVVITATRHAMLAIDAPASMSVVTRQEIEARGADDVLDALRAETGVSLQGRAVGGRKVISLRGMDSKHTLFLVDGRRIGASDGTIGASDFQYDWIAMEDVERIEVVRGPLSVLYGSEAMGGVVNVITRQPGERWQVSARAEGQRASGGRGGDGHRVAASADGPLSEQIGLRAGVAQARRQAVTSPTDAQISELEGLEKTDGWAGLVWRPSQAHRLEVDHHRGDETRWADARERGGARRYHRTENRIGRSLSSLGWTADWGASSSSQLRAYQSVIDVVNERTNGVSVNLPQRLTDRVLEGQWRQAAGAHALTAGFEVHNETLRDPGLPGGSSLARHRSVYAQDEIAATSSLGLTLGLRHDRHQLFGDELSPRAYLVWRAAPDWVVKGGISHGFKAPNLKQIVPGSRQEGPNTFLGNPDLVPETSDGAELGVAWSAGRTEAQLTVFDQRVRDLIEVQLVAPGPVPGIGTYTYANVARATLRGVEASFATALPAGFSTQIAWTWLDATDADGEPLTRRPRQTVGARLDWQGGPWKAGLRLDHSGMQWLPSATVGAPDVRGADLTVLGAHVARELQPGVTLTLGVDNLTDVRPADKNALYTQAEPPRTWRLALSGHW